MDQIYISVILILRRSQKYNFCPYCLNWGGRGSHTIPLVGGFLTPAKNDKFLRNVLTVTLFSVLIRFIIRHV